MKGNVVITPKKSRLVEIIPFDFVLVVTTQPVKDDDDSVYGIVASSYLGFFFYIIVCLLDQNNLPIPVLRSSFAMLELQHPGKDWPSTTHRRHDWLGRGV